MTPINRIKQEAERYTKDEGYQKSYIAGATATQDRAQEELKRANDAAIMFCNKYNVVATQLAETVDRAKVLVDALEGVRAFIAGATSGPIHRNKLLALKELDKEIEKALEQWQGKEVGDE